MNKDLALKILSRIFCIVGCSYHLFQMNKIHFSCRTTTNVIYEDTNVIELPGISICYDKRAQLNQEFSDVEKLNDKLFIKEQFESLKSYESILEICVVKDKYSLYHRECQELTKIITYLDGDEYCFTTFSQIDGKLDENFIVYENGTNSNMLVVMYLNKTLYSVKRQYKFFFHDRKTKLFKPNVKGQMMLDFQRGQNSISYRKTIVKFLFSPSMKPCFKGTTTREQCFYECEIRNFINLAGKYPKLNLVKQGYNESLKFSTKDEFLNISEKLGQNCNEMCDQNTDCYKEYFNFEGKETKTSIQRYQIWIDIPTHPTTIYEISLKMSFDEYLCLMASILSLWFGFSILVFTDFCQLVYKKFLVFNVSSITLNQNNKVFIVRNLAKQLGSSKQFMR